MYKKLLPIILTVSLLCSCAYFNTAVDEWVDDIAADQIRRGCHSVSIDLPQHNSSTWVEVCDDGITAWTFD